MTDTQLLFAGPAFALLALMLFAIPGVRPKALTLGIGWLAACMLFPMVIGFAFQSSGFISLAFVLKPIAAMGCATLFVGYSILSWSKGFPLITSAPSLLMLCGSGADILAVYRLGNAWGGASC